MQFNKLVKKIFVEMNVKVRKSPTGYMGSASRPHKSKKGTGSFKRNPKHKKPKDTDD